MSKSKSFLQEIKDSGMNPFEYIGQEIQKLRDSGKKSEKKQSKA